MALLKQSPPFDKHFVPFTNHDKAKRLRQRLAEQFLNCPRESKDWI